MADPNEAQRNLGRAHKQASEIAKIGRATDEVMVTNIERVREQMRMAGAPARSKGRCLLIRSTTSVL